MPLRDDRRGRRATIFANAAIFSPRFESADKTQNHAADGAPISRWWRRFVSWLQPYALPVNRERCPGFAELVAAEVIAGRTDAEPTAVDRNPSEPQSSRRFEVDVEAFDRRERIIPITRRRLQPRTTVPAERGQIDLLRGLLGTGDDAERAAAIDEFARRGLRAELIFALEDRLEPLAAKAALALAGSANRDELIRAIEPHVSEGRLAAILSFLPGLG